MKKNTQVLLIGSLLLLSACGQKGPLIVETPVTKPASISTPSTTTSGVEEAEVEVQQDESILNIQTDEKATAR